MLSLEAGELVQQPGGPIMTIVSYATKKETEDPASPDVDDETRVICKWLDGEDWQEGTFRVNTIREANLSTAEIEELSKILKLYLNSPKKVSTIFTKSTNDNEVIRRYADNILIIFGIRDTTSFKGSVNRLIKILDGEEKIENVDVKVTLNNGSLLSISGIDLVRYLSKYIKNI